MIMKEDENKTLRTNWKGEDIEKEEKEKASRLKTD